MIGEAPSSWVMKGVIDFLLSSSEEAETLRQNYVFRIVPMLNPDGVIYGNYRCCLLGYDLNRRWKSPDRSFHPTIYYTKRTIRYINQERKICFFCDLHAHSIQRNIFMYGCSCIPTDLDSAKKNATTRMIPLLMSQLDENFSYKFSEFLMEKSRESTSRIVVFRKFNIVNSYTCEASFFAYYLINNIDLLIQQKNMRK